MQAKLFVADVVEALASGKQILMGLYPDNVVVVDSSPQADHETLAHEFIVQIAFLVTLLDIAPGEHDYGVKILDPAGNPVIAEQPPMKIVALPAASVNIMFPARLIKFKAFGLYRFISVIGVTEVVAEFEIRKAPIQALKAVAH